MDIRINSVNFTGKKEILYGLTKAAENVHSYSVCRQLGKSSDAEKYEIAAKAYLDMVTKDAIFTNYALLSRKKELEVIRGLLKPTEPAEIKPLKDFANFIQSVIKQNGTKKEKIYMKSALEDLFEKLA